VCGPLKRGKERKILEAPLSRSEQDKKLIIRSGCQHSGGEFAGIKGNIIAVQRAN